MPIIRNKRLKICFLLKQEVLSFKPLLCESALSQRFNQWNIDDSNLPQEHTLVMVMREAKKRMQSGQKRALVIDDLFSGKKKGVEQLCMLVFGVKIYSLAIAKQTRY